MSAENKSVEFEAKYKCENCGEPLGSHNGNYWNGLLLCERCRAIANTMLGNGKYDYTPNGMPFPG